MPYCWKKILEVIWKPLKCEWWNESMEEVDMDGSVGDQELTGNETDASEWASKVHEHVWSMFIWSTKDRY